MTTSDIRTSAETFDAILHDLQRQDLHNLARNLSTLSAGHIVDVLERLGERQRAIVYRLLQKDLALAVFEALPPALQGDLVHGLQDEQVASLFAGLDPDDRVWLLDELPAKLAPKLLRGLTDQERQLTGSLLGYPQGSVGRRMSPGYVTARPAMTVAQTLSRIRENESDAETVYALPVIDDGRRVIGAVSLRQLVVAEPEELIEDLMQPAECALATQKAEDVARRCAELGFLALPIVDSESRLVGIFTIDDAARILEHEETEDVARQGGVEPLRRPYLSTPTSRIVRSRIVWLFVLAVGATLTVQVLSVFEATLEQVTVLALFVPLLIGTGGNTGNQAATTVTRSLALGDLDTRDIFRVFVQELRVGFTLGLGLGTLGFGITALVYEPRIGWVIGLTLVAICSVAATIGGIMPIIARTIKVDPAVFSNPFITTFVDATGLIIYFLIARAILQI